MHHGRRAWLGLCLAAGAMLFTPMRSLADQIDFTQFDISHNAEGVFLSFALRFELPAGVEDALSKGVPLYFVAEAAVYSERWYWTDKHITTASQVWRVAYQPLTRKYRVTFGGTNQSFDTVDEALAAVRSASNWKIAEPGQIDDARHYVEFSYRLDTTLLPRPVQIGIGSQPDWTLVVDKTQRFR